MVRTSPAPGRNSEAVSQWDEVDKTFTHTLETIALAGAPAFTQDAQMKGDPAAGEQVFNQFQACHVVQDDDGETLAGRAGRVSEPLPSVRSPSRNGRGLPVFGRAGRGRRSRPRMDRGGLRRLCPGSDRHPSHVSRRPRSAREDVVQAAFGRGCGGCLGLHCIAERWVERRERRLTATVRDRLWVRYSRGRVRPRSASSHRQQRRTPA
ncbi:hypothetical protein SAMN04488020_105133 [Palleronia marisminoris]|uniref:Cytochrome c2 n=1 Tax=Palleronia marisminoris TaxID=315423 RepID=A0A1Y5SSC4_9RHOB|nr:hypothetical protein SAMN04488020_105133 [Palleronia marisminoris]SLN47252.1 Cytochrome c2 [Palleronia marisminoris]